MEQFKLPSNPTCGIVVSKEGEVEHVCGQPATQLITMVDPETKTRVIAILLLCEHHDQELENGKEFVMKSDNGEERILVNYHTKEE